MTNLLRKLFSVLLPDDYIVWQDSDDMWSCRRGKQESLDWYYPASAVEHCNDRPS